MPFTIVRNDITNMQVDAIVNTANPKPLVGSGTDTMVHEKAGPALLEARQRIGQIARGDAAITPAYRLQAKYVIHTVGPAWVDGNQGEEETLRSCYDKSLALAVEYGCKSIAFPLIATGNYGFPKDKALQIAIAAFSEFLLGEDIQIYLVVFDRTAYSLSEKLFSGVASYIDENFVDACQRTTEKANRLWKRERMQKEADRYMMEDPAVGSSAMKPMLAVESCSLQDMLRQEDRGFSEDLLSRIDKTGKKDSEIYKRANLSKQHFSKIRNNPDYKPTKATALALALALELDVEQTKDLIGRAGYALTNSSKFDLIIRYYIEQRNYNIVEINMTLYEFDQPLLGS